MNYPDAMRKHWPEYLIEACCLGTFMVSACLFSVLFQHPDSPIHDVISNPTLRRVLTGLAMGLTAITIIYSPWGKQSGAHMNPSVTLTFLRMGKVKPQDALFYILAQFVGGAAGVFLCYLLIGKLVAHPSVNFAVTVPGMKGLAIAFGAELLISFLMMSMILRSTSRPRLANYTGIFAGMLVATFISLEGPFSGMSMNPARTFGSDIAAHVWTAYWIYLTAPPLGMLLAAQVFLSGSHSNQGCAKYHHENSERCIFCGKGM